MAAVAALVLAFTALLTPAGAVSAAAGETGAAHRSFTAQARAAGLTLGEAEELQGRVDAYLVQAGGRQVAANRIEYGSGGGLLLALPGEKAARELGQPIGTMADCWYLYFCAYSAQNYYGDMRYEDSCSQLISIPWSWAGSWKNAQTTGTRARFLTATQGLYQYSAPASSRNPNYSWAPVYYIDPC
ncbi:MULTISPECIES: hypothetical protein [Micromonospora]|uniref:hypothetical protein n=1 Tax=Micromonospora TaxID=1873 RepID=UPI0024A260EA|nr:hypothetical protein [Micromonospora sp. NBRC 107095]GLZ58952.1 hypothetical protein Misp05_25280 [Micromonospora sp. NBRC 107095]